MKKCLCTTFFVCLDHRGKARVFSATYLKRQREGYRRIAFPKGGARTIRTRDQQNHALVARGGMFAMDALLEQLQEQEAKQS